MKDVRQSLLCFDASGGDTQSWQPHWFYFVLVTGQGKTSAAVALLDLSEETYSTDFLRNREVGPSSGE